MAYLTKQQTLDIINKAPANLNKEVLLKELSQTNTIEGYNEQPKKSNLLKDIGRDIVKPFAQGAELLSSGAKAYGSVIKGGFQLAVGNKEGAKQTLLSAEQQAKNRPQVNVLDQNVGNLKTAKQTTGAVLNIASNFVGGVGAKTIGGQLLKQSLKETAIQGAKIGAKTGALYGAGNALQTNKNVLSETLQGTASGALGGAILSPAIGAVGKAVPLIKQKAFEMADNKLLSLSKELLKMSPKASQSEAKWGKNTARFITDEFVNIDGKDKNILSLIGADGKKLNTDEASNALRAKANDENGALESVLKDSGAKISLDEWGSIIKGNLEKDLANKGTDLQKALNKVDEEINAYKKNAVSQGIGQQFNGEVYMDADKFNLLKKGAWEKSSVSRKVPGSELDADLFYQMGHSAKDLIEKKVDDAGIQKMNSRLGDLAQAIKVLDNANGRVIPGGFFGKGITKIAGTIAGSTFGLPGSIIGNITGGALADITNNPQFRTGLLNKLRGQLSKTAEGKSILQEAAAILEKRGLERKARILLESPKSIPLGGKSDTSKLFTQKEAQALMDALKIKEPQKLLEAPGKNPILLPSKTDTSKELIKNKQVKYKR